ncbi:hypothetical protein JOM56_006869 [Amanita muscaria]
MSTKEFEHAYYIGNYTSGILYGIEIVMYTVCMNKLLFSKRHRRFQSSRLFLSVFSTLLFILITIDISTNAVWGEQMWITFRDEPGGVPLFIETQVSVWYETLSSTSVVVMIFMGDALLIYRLYIIYDSNLWLVVLPCLTWCTALALAIIQLVISGTPGGNFFNGKTIDFGTPYYALTISMNVVITSLICFRLLYYSRRIKRILGAETAKTYTGVAAILIESAAPYSLVGLMFLIPYTQKSGTAIAFGQVWAKMTCLSPQLIILRVTSGRAWGKDTLDYHSRSTPGGSGRGGICSGPDKSEVMTTGLEFSPISEDGGQSSYEPESPVFAYGAEKSDELKPTKSKSTLAYSSTAYTEKTTRDSDK